MPGSIQPGRASQRDSPCGVLVGSVVALRRRNSGILAAAAAAAAPCGPVVVHPVEQSGFEADVLSGGLAEAPFVAEDFVAFREVYSDRSARRIDFVETRDIDPRTFLQVRMRRTF